MPELETVTLRDPSSSLTATYVPNAGMIGTSLSDDGVELLGQRRGLQAYVSTRQDDGHPDSVPVGEPVERQRYGVDGAVVTLDPRHRRRAHRRARRADPRHAGGLPGLACHQQLGPSSPRNWISARTPDCWRRSRSRTCWSWTSTLADRTLTVRTTVTPTTARAVPLCFGFHPYLQLPDVPRARVADRDAGDAAPSGRRHGAFPPARWTSGRRPQNCWATSVFDDGYDEVADGAVFALSGGDRRIEVHFDEGYTAAQVFAPAAATMWSASSRWPRRPTRCAAAATGWCSPASRPSRSSRINGSSLAA